MSVFKVHFPDDHPPLDVEADRFIVKDDCLLFIDQDGDRGVTIGVVPLAALRACIEEEGEGE